MKQIIVLLAAILLAGCGTVGKMGAVSILYLPHGETATVSIAPAAPASAAK
jgi:uncharacterized lipoprotein YmbA